LHAFSKNATNPVYAQPLAISGASARPLRWVAHEGGVLELGADESGFAFDNERPRHRAFVEPFELASRLVTNGEYLEFIEDGGYRRPELWLSEGFERASLEKWTAPLYWRQRDDRWWQFGLRGEEPLEVAAPVVHVSLYEADAFARWASARLPTESEWEAAASALPLEGNLLESLALRSRPAKGAGPLEQMFGDAWEWTQSAYAPYPGFRPVRGALGEYNGKFMCSQYVLRGGSFATAQSHLRASYRNFFHPWARWQFSGIRLARDLGTPRRRLP
jgi:ergothioneine biosynthesis protein EgtB